MTQYGCRVIYREMFSLVYYWFNASGSLLVNILMALAQLEAHCMHHLHIVLVNHLSRKCHVTNYPAFITS